LGYVGTVSAGCLAYDGHEVVGVDPLPTTVDLINRGQSPIVEKDVGEIIAATVKAGRLRATGDPSQAIRETELSFVCVGTPSQPNGNLDLRYIQRICEQNRLAELQQTWHYTSLKKSRTPPSTSFTKPGLARTLWEGNSWERAVVVSWPFSSHLSGGRLYARD
jgi:GDP-mannose 6-dehydrogenase